MIDLCFALLLQVSTAKPAVPAPVPAPKIQQNASLPFRTIPAGKVRLLMISRGNPRLVWLPTPAALSRFSCATQDPSCTEFLRLVQKVFAGGGPNDMPLRITKTGGNAGWLRFRYRGRGEEWFPSLFVPRGQTPPPADEPRPAPDPRTDAGAETLTLISNGSIHGLGEHLDPTCDPDVTEDSTADLRQVPGYGRERRRPARFTAVGGYDPRTGGISCYCTE